jgi:hypothetical protein
MRQQRQAHSIERGPRVRINKKPRRRRRQDPSHRTARRFEDEQHGDGAEREIDRRRIRRPINELAEGDERPRECHDRRADQDPVDERHASGASLAQRKEQKRQHQCNEQEADAIHLGLDDEQNPVEGIERQADAQHRGQASRKAADYTRGRFISRCRYIASHAYTYNG